MLRPRECRISSIVHQALEFVSRCKTAASVFIIVFFVTACHPDPAVTIEESWRHLSSANGDLPLPMYGTQQTASLVADLDANGVDDIVIAERTSTPSVVWLRRTSRGWERHLIESEQLPIEAGGATADIDGDGDVDIVFGGDYRSPNVWWWENPNPDFDADRDWQRRPIKTSGSGQHHDQIFGDFDGDGHSELVFWNQKAKRLFLARKPKNPRSSSLWSLSVIYEWGNDIKHEGLAAADVDGDGTTDLVGGGNWYRYEGGNHFSAHPIDITMRFTRAAVGQLVEGGRPEVVFVPGDTDGSAKWYQWNGKKWVSNVLEKWIVHGHSLQLGDVDGDGHLDVFIAEMGRWGKSGINPAAKMLLYLGNGNGEFSRKVLGNGFGNHESRLGDLDGDGDLDILGKPYNLSSPRIDVFLNRGTGVDSPKFSKLPIDRWRRHHISDIPNRAMFVAVGDLDGDRRRDIAAGSFWWRNPGEVDGLWDRRSFGNSMHNLALLYDFDQDGDLDILGTEGIDAAANANFVYARNDSDGHFTIRDTIPEGKGDFLQGVTAARFTESASLEIALSWHRSGNGVQMLRVPRDASEGAWSWRMISQDSQDEDLSHGDIDGDGDLDLLLGTVWLENRSNEDGTWVSHSIDWISWDQPDRNELVDVDRDGRIDAVVGLENGSDLIWYRSGDDPKRPWEKTLIDSSIAGGYSMDCADLDDDGDVDVVLGEHSGDPNRVIIFENRRWGAEWTPHIIDSGPSNEIDHHDGTQIYDIDDDGDLDIVSLGWNNPRIWLYENLAIH